MSRVQDILMNPGEAWAAGRQSPMVNAIYGGQNGIAPVHQQWVSNTGYVRKNLICMVLEAPLGFQLLPNPEKWVGMLRAMWELHAQRITGLNAGLEVEFAETPVGGAGQVHHDVTNVRETPSNIVLGLNEKYGLPFFNFHRAWITNLLMDPNSKFANIATLGNIPTDMLADMMSATMLFIEPDPTHTKVNAAWMVANMMPQQTGERQGARDLTAAGEPSTYDIPYTGTTHYGAAVDSFAQRMLASMSLTGANPYNRASFADKVSSDVLATPSSYRQGIAGLAGNSQALGLGA